MSSYPTNTHFVFYTAAPKAPCGGAGGTETLSVLQNKTIFITNSAVFGLFTLINSRAKESFSEAKW